MNWLGLQTSDTLGIRITKVYFHLLGIWAKTQNFITALVKSPPVDSQYPLKKEAVIPSILGARLFPNENIASLIYNTITGSTNRLVEYIEMIALGEVKSKGISTPMIRHHHLRKKWSTISLWVTSVKDEIEDRLKTLDLHIKLLICT